MRNFALIGAAGYIAPKHLKAIKETGNNLLASLDKNDSVGILDSFFPDADFFTEPEIFDRHLEKLKYDKNINIDFLSICTPNYLHDSHVRMALRRQTDAICEKPLVLNPWNLDSLQKIEKQSGRKIWTIFQLRHHPVIIDLFNSVKSQKVKSKYEIDLTYITSRGNWYYSSWKGDKVKSGGVSTNIGVHFFDMLCWIFGKLQKSILHVKSHDREAGFLEFENARVRWFLSINQENLPKHLKSGDIKTYRSIKINGNELEFSQGFKNLHTTVYKNILCGNGAGIEEAKPSTEIIYNIRNSDPIGLKGEFHPMAKQKLSPHPFKKIIQ